MSRLGASQLLALCFVAASSEPCSCSDGAVNVLLFRVLEPPDAWIHRLSGRRQPLDLTATVLRRFEIPFDHFAYEDFPKVDVSRYTHIILGEEKAPVGLGQGRKVLAKHRREIDEFIRRGGVVIGLRSGVPAESWLPEALSLRTDRGRGSHPVPAAGEHPILTTPHNMLTGAFGFFDPPPKFRFNRLWTVVWDGTVSGAFCDLGDAWTPVAKPALWHGENPGQEHFAIVVARHGKGEVILCQMIPAFGYAARNWTSSGELLCNLFVYARLKVKWKEKCWERN